jgi:DNA-binding transcriptional LysR family regulator
VNLRSLRIFRRVVTTGSLVEASASLNISVSAASRLLSLLESELGLTLFSRAKRRLELTEEGDRFYRQAEHLLRGLDELTSLSRDIKRQTKERLSLVSAAPLGMGLISPTLGRMRRDGLDFECILNVETRFDIESKVAARAYNIGVVSLPIENAIVDLAVEPFLEAQMGVLMPHDHPLARFDALTLDQLVDQPFATLYKGQRWRDRLDEVFAHDGHLPRIAIETTSTPVIKQLVCDGLGLALVDLICGRPAAGDGLVFRPLAEERWIVYAAIHPKGPRPALAESFVEGMCQFIESECARDPAIAATVRLI